MWAHPPRTKRTMLSVTVLQLCPASPRAHRAKAAAYRQRAARWHATCAGKAPRRLAASRRAQVRLWPSRRAGLSDPANAACSAGFAQSASGQSACVACLAGYFTVSVRAAVHILTRFCCSPREASGSCSALRAVSTLAGHLLALPKEKLSLRDSRWTLRQHPSHRVSALPRGQIDEWGHSQHGLLGQAASLLRVAGSLTPSMPSQLCANGTATSLPGQALCQVCVSVPDP
jgi:hypothetical protein